MFYDAAKRDHGLAQDPLKALIVPRPIGWISTVDREGRVNLAPYSFYNGVGEFPPMVYFAITGTYGDTPTKHSRMNAEETGEFVVNLVDETLVRAMTVCAAEFPPAESEIPAAGLTLRPCTGVAPGRIAEAPASLGCRTHTVIDLSPERRIVLGQVVSLQARPDLFTPDGRHLRDGAFLPVGRLYGDLYARTGDRFAVPRVTPHEAREAARALTP